MNIHDATEVAYKNGFNDGAKKCAEEIEIALMKHNNLAPDFSYGSVYVVHQATFKVLVQNILNELLEK